MGEFSLVWGQQGCPHSLTSARGELGRAQVAERLAAAPGSPRPLGRHGGPGATLLAINIDPARGAGGAGGSQCRSHVPTALPGPLQCLWRVMSHPGAHEGAYVYIGKNNRAAFHETFIHGC